jgi:hypothetical protein
VQQCEQKVFLLRIRILQNSLGRGSML